MRKTRLIRYTDGGDLAARAAHRLVRALAQAQADGRAPQLCLGGGDNVLAVLEHFAQAVPGSGLDPALLELWWAEEAFAPTGSPERVAGPMIAKLSQINIDPARIHPMPVAEASIDVSVAAENYSKELEAAQFDVLLAEVGPAGSVFHVSPETPKPAYGMLVSALPGADGHPDRLFLTRTATERAAEAWLLASGPGLAPVLAAAVTDSLNAPVMRVNPSREIVWMADEAAAAGLPYFRCAL